MMKARRAATRAARRAFIIEHPVFIIPPSGDVSRRSVLHVRLFALIFRSFASVRGVPVSPGCPPVSSFGETTVLDRGHSAVTNPATTDTTRFAARAPPTTIFSLWHNDFRALRTRLSNPPTPAITPSRISGPISASGRPVGRWSWHRPSGSPGELGTAPDGRAGGRLRKGASYEHQSSQEAGNGGAGPGVQPGPSHDRPRARPRAREPRRAPHPRRGDRDPAAAGSGRGARRAPPPAGAPAGVADPAAPLPRRGGRGGCQGAGRAGRPVQAPEREREQPGLSRRRQDAGGPGGSPARRAGG